MERRMFMKHGVCSTAALTTAAIPPGEWALFRMAMDIAADYRPIEEEGTARLRELASKLEPIFHSA